MGKERIRREFKDWPQINFKGLRILLANTDELHKQGFAGAKEKEFENTIIVFPEIWEGPFDNKDYGYGPVVRDIKIAYLDKDYNKVGEDIMVRETGISYPPKGAKIAIEGLP